MRLKTISLMTLWALSGSTSPLFSAQIVHQNGEFESVTFERHHYPEPAKKQSPVVRKQNNEETVIYNPKCDMFLLKKNTQSKEDEEKT